MKSSRASQSRTKEVKKTTWTPPSSLDAPPAPDGYKHRWLRAEVLGFDDTKNMAGHLRSGFELVRAEEYPNSEYPVIQEGKYKGMIGVGGLLLGRIPNEVVEARKEYFAKLTQDKTDAINSDLMKEQHPSMPINSERQTRVTFGGTKKS
jgi:malate synthase